MGRPRKKIPKTQLNLTLNPSVIEQAKEYAFECNESLSQLIERLLREEMAGNTNASTHITDSAIAVGKHAKASVKK